MEEGEILRSLLSLRMTVVVVGISNCLIAELLECGERKGVSHIRLRRGFGVTRGHKGAKGATFGRLGGKERFFALVSRSE